MAIRKPIQQRIDTASDVVMLDHLNIEDKELEEILMDVVRKKTSIHSIYLQRNELSDKGVEYLAKILHSCTTLRYLDLQFNHIGEKGIKVLIQMEKDNPALKIALHGNQVKDEGVMHRLQL